MSECREDRLRIYQAQMRVREDKEESLAAAEEAARRGASLGADLVCLPEMFCCPYEAALFPGYAEPAGGRVWSRCAEIAAKLGVWLSAGSFPEVDSGGRVYNTAFVFDRAGRQAARHRKMHLFDIDVRGGQRFRESDTLTPGGEVTVFPTEFGPMGLCVCYDFRFPELGRLMALRGARLVLVPGAFNMTTGPAHWELTFRGQAMFNQFFAAGTSPARDMTASYHAWGHSLVADPWGAVTASLDESEGGLLTAPDLSECARVREQLPLLRHRREDIYTLRENAGESVNA